MANVFARPIAAVLRGLDGDIDVVVGVTVGVRRSGAVAIVVTNIELVRADVIRAVKGCGSHERAGGLAWLEWVLVIIPAIIFVEFPIGLIGKINDCNLNTVMDER